jgi:hypothetical protein
MITELPHTNTLTESIETSLHLDQAVDLHSWTRIHKDNHSSLQSTASLSFLIPLSTTTTTERTLIVSLMEHDAMGNVGIATRRLANLPLSPSSANNKRMSAVLNVELSSHTTCTTMTRKVDSEYLVSQVQDYHKAFGMCVVLLFGGVLMYMVDPNKHKVATASTTHEEEGESIHEVESVSRLKHTIFIDSPGGSNDNSTCSSTIQGDESDDTRHARAKPQIIMPPSLVRIPYSFAAEHESEEESCLSVNSCTGPPQGVYHVGGIRQDAFPSPVVDVKKNTSHYEKEDNERENRTNTMIPEETQGPRNSVQQQDAVVEKRVLPSQVVDVAETPMMDDTTVIDREVMESLGTAIDPDNTCLSVEQDTNDSTVGETEMEVRQDEIVRPRESSSNEPETATLLLPQSASRSPSQQQGDDNSDRMSSSSGNIPIGQQASDEENASPALTEISKVGPVDISQTTSATRRAHNVNPSPSENAQSFEVVNASFGSADESKVLPPPLEEDQTLESTIDGQDSQDSSDAPNKGCDSIQARAEEESSQITCEPLDVQDQSLEKNDVIPTGGDNDENSPHVSDQHEANRELESKVIDVECIPMEESNWLKRLRERPSAITSCSVGQNDAPASAQEESKEPEKDELSYASTLSPDSFGGDDFSVDDATAAIQDTVGTAVNEIQVAAAINSDAQDLRRPQRKKRRLPSLKSRYHSDKDSDIAKQDARPDKTGSRKQAASTTTEFAIALVPQTNATLKPAARPKKPSTDTIVPDVVPSVLLQAASREVTDVEWNFSKAASTARRSKQEKQRSRRRKRKGPPSLIILLDDGPPVPSQSVVSRGSSRKKSTEGVSGKRRRLKK